MKTTLELPDLLLRKAKALAAQQGRPLRDLVAEALGEKLEYTVGAAKASEGRRQAWEHWRSRLKQLPDGSWFNPDGIEDESFFRALDEIHPESWTHRDPFGTDS
ncbi:MAG TPA: hypothetical protein VNW71_24485 [Thermoanaerobaculia bacterium]|nr:hypothetical protein [Thermoanaerobaculia bacterium]